MTVKIRYRNHKKEIAWRTILPQHIFYGRTVWHPDLQWFLEAQDLDKQAVRTFAMADILDWQAGEEPGEDPKTP